ncbi:LysR family transcriptional regulator [Amylibacter ulvae]|uniref:LysR family transcriptional regulator n=1 Tax=Paramylibacter ulvae TaxID=1651968 RepID=A0ABQ3CVJ6_9RHOB|nr:LysR family transcriptional regulator [Amylibacter ulvae]GHA43795.1 LysR family transcriptional regulator [Amylibacter ulvae]
MPKSRNLNRLAYFAAVVETGSFTNAGVRLGVTKAVVSSQVTQLEQELQTTLLVRNTRKVSATEAGQAFYIACASILHEADDAFNQISERTQMPAGTLRITAPNDYGIAIITPVVAAFRSRYPDCKVELYLNDGHSDLMAGDLDLAIRVGWLRDSTLRVRKIRRFRQILVGAADRVEQLGRINHPTELRNVDFIANKALSDPMNWNFENDDAQSVSVKLNGGLCIDSAGAILQAVKDGAGLAILPDYLVHEQLQRGELLHVLPDWSLAEGGIFAVLPVSKFRPAKVTVFVEMLRSAEKERN